MRVVFKVLTFQFLISSSLIYSQEDILEKKISCVFIEEDLETIIDKIHNSSGIVFIYSDDIIPKSIRVTIRLGEVSLRTVLDQITTIHFPDIEYLCNNKKVIIRDREKHTFAAILPSKNLHDDLLERDQSLTISKTQILANEELKSTKKSMYTEIKTYSVQHLSTLPPRVEFTNLINDNLHYNQLKSFPIQHQSKKIGKPKMPASPSTWSRLFQYSISAGYGLGYQLQPKYYYHKGFINLNLNKSLINNFHLLSGAGFSFSTLALDLVDIVADSSTIDYIPGDSTNYYSDSIRVQRKVSGSVLFIEIPIFVNFSKPLNDSWSLNISTGISNFILLSEKYRSASIPETDIGLTTNWLVLYRFSFGLERTFGKSISFQIQPTLNLPLNGNGLDKIRYKSIEVRLICTFEM